MTNFYFPTIYIVPLKLMARLPQDYLLHRKYVMKKPPISAGPMDQLFNP